MARIPPRLLSAEPDRREVLRSLGALSIGALSGLPARAQRKATALAASAGSAMRPTAVCSALLPK